jgi:hypothetical protein
MGMKPEQLETAQFKREVAKLKAERPHSALGNLPPAAYAKSALLEFNGTGRRAIPRAPRSVPLHHGAIKAQMTAGLYSSAHETRAQVTLRCRFRVELLLLPRARRCRYVFARFERDLPKQRHLPSAF